MVCEGWGFSKGMVGGDLAKRRRAHEPEPVPSGAEDHAIKVGVGADQRSLVGGAGGVSGPCIEDLGRWGVGDAVVVSLDEVLGDVGVGLRGLGGVVVG